SACAGRGARRAADVHRATASLPCTQANECLTGHEWVAFPGDSQQTPGASLSCARLAAHMQNQLWLPPEPPLQSPSVPPTPPSGSFGGGSSLPPPPPPPQRARGVRGGIAIAAIAAVLGAGGGAIGAAFVAEDGGSGGPAAAVTTTPIAAHDADNVVAPVLDA